MNYKLIYDNLIFRAQNRVLEGYSEKHHIIARCFGGTNAKSNIVKLTGKEHYLAHRLLTKIYPSHKGLAFAFWMMCNSTKRTAYKPSPKAYEEAKQQIAKRVREHLGTPEAIKKMRDSKRGMQLWLGRKHSLESRLKQSQSAKVRKITEEGESKRREGISKRHKGVKHSEEHKLKGSLAKVGEKNPMFGVVGKSHPASRPLLQYTLEGNLVKEWDNIAIAEKELKITPRALYAVVKTKNKIKNGFVWKYKN